jgi:hypothetical protein
MRPFDLEKALAGAPVCTRSGDPVTQLTPFTITSSYSLRGVIDGELFAWTLDGKYKYIDHEWDLFMAPIKKTGWVARRGDIRVSMWLFGTKGAAHAAHPDALSYHEISWEE